MCGPTGSVFRALALAFAAGGAAIAAPAPNAELASAAIAARVDALLARMTLEEKIGQMVQFPMSNELVGPRLAGQPIEPMLARGEIGGLNVSDAKRANAYQRIAVEKSRLHIPLIIGLDVLHGYRTVYPIPLALAASFDPELATELSRVAAKEASADGIRMTNAPMVDIARDARWGRAAEGAGESPFLGSAMAAAYVRGFQGRSLADPDSIVACVKHFAAYGAVEAGRDYNATDMSDLRLRQVYLPPYHAAVDAGAASIMSGFTSLNSVPETADPYTLTDILRGEWGFAGFVRCDYNAIGELIAHGVALDGETAARKAVMAGVDMDMASNLYHEKLAGLVLTGGVPQRVIDEAVRRILRVKFALGLFEHPYVDENAPPVGPTPAKRVLARRAAEESFVLLQNQGRNGQPGPLPIDAAAKTVALIGPLADAPGLMLGTWRAKGRANDVVSLRAALEQRMEGRGGKLLFAEGSRLVGGDHRGLVEARQAAEKADVVVLALGEDPRTMTGEATSRAHLDLPGEQEALLESVAAVGKPTVLVVFSGRPLVLAPAAARVGAILEAWFPGIEAGPALADVLFGDASPSGRLPMTFPRAEGQEPLYLAELPTGRPSKDPNRVPAGRAEKFVSAYVDVPVSPLFPFGYGLSYTRFEFSPVTLSAAGASVAAVTSGPGVRATVTVRNVGSRAATDVVQLYVRIRGASVEEPVRTLEGFRRVALAPGESKEVGFPVGYEQLSFIDAKSRRVVEPCDYDIFIGDSSSTGPGAMLQVSPN